MNWQTQNSFNTVSDAVNSDGQTGCKKEQENSLFSPLLKLCNSPIRFDFSQFKMSKFNLEKWIKSKQCRNYKKSLIFSLGQKSYCTEETNVARLRLHLSIIYSFWYSYGIDKRLIISDYFWDIKEVALTKYYYLALHRDHSHITLTLRAWVRNLELRVPLIT